MQIHKFYYVIIYYKMSELETFSQNPAGPQANGVQVHSMGQEDLKVNNKINVSVYLTIFFIISNFIDAGVLIYNKYIVSGIITILVYLTLLIVLLYNFFQHINWDKKNALLIKIIFIIFIFSVLFGKIIYSLYLMDDNEIKKVASKYYIIISEIIKGIVSLLVIYNIYSAKTLTTQIEDNSGTVEMVGGKRKKRIKRKRKN